MRARVLPVVVVVAVALLGFAPAPLPRKQRQPVQDPTDVGGTWAFVLWEVGGERERQSEQTMLAEVTKERFRLVTKNGQGHEAFVMRLDATASPPAFTWAMGDRTWFVGSYRLRGDELTLIFGRGERVQDRPTDFAAAAAYRFVLRRLER
jgi:uncharacterized protein (TIGR03067 family)